MRTRTSIRTALVASLLWIVVGMGATPLDGQSAAPAAGRLPDYLALELERLETTWQVLDQHATAVWPGWRNHVDVPFLFSYPNGVRMLVGHPSPTDDFELVPGVEIRGKKVFLDRRHEIPLEMKPPIIGGGGVIPYGKAKLVQTVNLNLSPVRPGEPLKGETEQVSSLPRDLVASSDGQILLNIHELFHCLQMERLRSRHGNLRMNPDAAYALYSEVEGLALERAYLATDLDETRRFVRDFLAARRLKRATMTESERNEESQDDAIEGTAVYSEITVLEAMKAGFDAGTAARQDRFFFGFRNPQAFLDERLNVLRRSRQSSLEASIKCYPFGAFQAVLLTRLRPGWQEGFFEQGLFLDHLLREAVGPEPAQTATDAAAALAARYPVAEIGARSGRTIRGRDAALDMVRKRTGRVYVVNFKPTGEYLQPKGRGEMYRVGLMEIYPEGIERLAVQDVVLTSEKTPVVKEQLYHVKWIDEADRTGDKDRFTLRYSRREGDDIYVDAVFAAPGFTLRAPKIQVKKSASRIKIVVLEKIRR